MNLLKLSSRIDAVAARVQTAVTMRQVTGSMATVVKGMDGAMSNMNLEKISMVMDKFEQQFEDLDVQAGYMEQSIGNTTGMSMPQGEVEQLMLEVADEHGLELNLKMGNAPLGQLESGKEAVEQKDELTARLAKLRNP